MSGKDYIEYIYLDHLLSGDFDEICADKWLPEQQMLQLFHSAMSDAFKFYDFDIDGRYSDIVDKIFNNLQNEGVLQIEGDEFIGSYRKFSVSTKDGHVKKLMAANPIAPRIAKLGDDALKVAVNNLAAVEGWASDTGSDDSSPENTSESVEREAPASDRIVTFSDNQITEIDQLSTEVIEAVSGQNQIDGQPGLREIVLGQLKAGRELVRAGSFRLYFIKLTLMDTLQFLAKRYEKEAIGGLAAALITALAKHLGLDA